ncbi:MAG: hypothetical protein AAB563_01135 [Patescibacteria group bacterium]
MLQIKTVEEGFEIKNGQQRLILTGEKINLGDLDVSEPGEYESEGVEIVYGESAALIVWDKLQLVYIFGHEKPTSFEKTQFSPCDTVIFGRFLQTLGRSFFNETLEQYDPSQVVVSTKTNTEEIQSSFKSDPVDTFKMSDQTMPEEGRDFVRLT